MVFCRTKMALLILFRTLSFLLFLSLVIANDDSPNDPPSAVHRTVGITLHSTANIPEASPSYIRQRRMLRDQGIMNDFQDVLKSNIVHAKLGNDKTMTFQARFHDEEQWYGDCTDGSGASANFVKSQTGSGAPRLIGSIRTGRGDTQYRISTNKSNELVALVTEGAHNLGERVLQQDEEELPEEASEQVASSYSMSELSSDENWSIDEDTITRVDIMVAYTRNAMCAAASLDFPCANSKENRQKILDIIEEEIAKTNLAFQLSQVRTRLNLVKTWMDEDYDEERDADADYRTILDHLTGQDDGYLDDVHDVRDEYGADLVAMMVNSRQNCGIAWLYSSAKRAFSLTAWFCNSFTFAHEIGHNMGCYHNRDDSTDQHPYAHGYQDEQSRYRTVMSYQCESQSCPRVPYFSNPDLLYFNNRGAPVGTADENCSLELNRLAPRIAKYRDEKEPDDDDDSSKGDDEDSGSTSSRSSRTSDKSRTMRMRSRKSSKSSKDSSKQSKSMHMHSKSGGGRGTGKSGSRSGSSSRRLRFVPYKK